MIQPRSPYKPVLLRNPRIGNLYSGFYIVGFRCIREPKARGNPCRECEVAMRCDDHALAEQAVQLTDLSASSNISFKGDNLKGSS